LNEELSIRANFYLLSWSIIPCDFIRKWKTILFYRRQL